MLTFDPTTTAALNLAASKLAWCEIIATALGATGRTLVCKRAASGDAWATGTVFRDLDMTGAISTTGAVLSSLGVTSNARVQLAADLTTGVSVWRISNAAGTRWMQGTLGAIGSGADVERPNPTATSGDDFTGVTIYPPLTLPSGTGPAAPAWTSNTPKTVVIMDYSVDPPVEAGRMTFNERDQDLVYEHADMAAEKGDAAIWMASSTVELGTMEIGAVLVRSAASNTVSGTKPLERVILSMKPTNWVPIPGVAELGYPSSQSYGAVESNGASPTITTYPPAFKALILNDADELVVNWEGKSAIEMSDGLPMNHPSLVQDGNYEDGVAVPAGTGPKWGTATTGVRPHVNCAMLPQWCNEQPRESEFAKSHWFNGVTGAALDPSSAKRQFSVNGMNKLFSTSQPNGFNDMWLMDKWPQADIVGNPARPSPLDAYAANPQGGSNPRNCYMAGWGYEPGAVGGHDWSPGAGGPRFNRSAIPSTMAIFFSDPNGARLEGGIPWRDIVSAWNDNMFNWSHHYVGDPRTLQGAIPKAESVAAMWGATKGWYGGPGVAPRTVPTVGSGNQEGKLAKMYDPTGRNPWSFYLNESYLHGYNHAGLAAWLFNSHAHAILQRFSFDSWSINALAERVPTMNPKDYVCQRRHAWRMLAYFATWICAGKHRLLYSRAEVESRLRIEMMTIYNQIWVPTYIDNNQDIYYDGIRKLGQPGEVRPGASGSGEELIVGYGDGGGLYYYMGHIMQMWKVTGMFDIVKGWGIEYQRVLELIIYTLSKPATEWIIATNGRFRSNRMSVPKPIGSSWSAADIPESFAALNAIHPSTGSANWYRDSAGAATAEAEGATLHLQPQWCGILRDFFPEYAGDYPVNEALAIYQAFYDERQAIIDSKTTDAAKGSAGWYHLVPSHGMLAPLAAVE